MRCFSCLDVVLVMRTTFEKYESLLEVIGKAVVEIRKVKEMFSLPQQTDGLMSSTDKDARVSLLGVIIVAQNYFFENSLILLNFLEFWCARSGFLQGILYQALWIPK